MQLFSKLVSSKATTTVSETNEHANKQKHGLSTTNWSTDNDSLLDTLGNHDKVWMPTKNQLHRNLQPFKWLWINIFNHFNYCSLHRYAKKALDYNECECKLRCVHNVNCNVIKITSYVFVIAYFSSEASGNYLLNNLENDSQ